MGNITPIQTAYKGYRFRSRLEARWAVFFDCLGLDWAYEPEGFNANGVMYLPDFLVSDRYGSKTWYEVKPKNINEDKKFEAFKNAKSDCFLESFCLISGDPLEMLGDEPGESICPRCGNYCKADDELAYYCHGCDMTTSSGIGNVEKGLFCNVVPYKGCILFSDHYDPVYHMANVKEAAIKARSARFEHFENSRYEK